MPFAYKLVLNQWLLSLFNVKRFEDLAEHLRNEALEGWDENNIHHFHHALTAQLFNLTQLPTDLLLEYDQNIVRHTQRLNERRITRGEAGNAVTFAGVPAGTVLPLRTRRVRSTGTTADDIVALF